MELLLKKTFSDTLKQKNIYNCFYTQTNIGPSYNAKRNQNTKTIKPAIFPNDDASSSILVTCVSVHKNRP